MADPRRVRPHPDVQARRRPRAHRPAVARLRPARGVAGAGHPARRERRPVPAADRPPVLHAGPGDPPGRAELRRGSHGPRLGYRRHEPPAAGAARGLHQQGVRQRVLRPAGQGSRRPGPAAAPGIRARGRFGGHRAGHVADHARRPGPRGGGTLPLLPCSRIEHRGRAHRAAGRRHPLGEPDMRIALAGTGAFGIKHLDGLANIGGVTVTAVVSRRLDQAEEVARKYGAGHATTDLDEVLARDDVDAVILCTPTQLHAAQSIAAMRAGKHVQVEIPVADSWPDAQEVYRVQQETGKVCVVGHTRRFNPSHQWVRRRILAGELSIQQMDVQTYFFRRTNMNAAGQPRSWTDHLLWHHAAHTVDLFQYQAGEQASIANAVQGPIHPELGIAMDMSIQLRTPSGKICTLSLSFNNDGPLGSFFRYICDNGTYLARYDDLVTGREEAIDVSKVDVSTNGIELQDREFIAAINERREPNSSIASVLGCYRVLGELETQLATQQ